MVTAEDPPGRADETPALRHIGEVAELTGLSHRTIRYYEEMGLVSPAARTDGGFRLYDQARLDRLRLITPMKPLGYSIEEIRDLLGALDALSDQATEEEGRAHARAVLRRSHHETQLRIAELRTQITRAEQFLRLVDEQLGATGTPKA
ncbi:MerR family transcriptional regulator [Ornithinimicrobium pekingense]|uniref:MerR family transcriptional regulator n=1 Tax=Ornithinimicrobium pekingense TaxID=384677 RepID=A0ABQ2FF99_9MICO|nr:MerR family transcriptional regulator [Ornithinimicrobium pekingense]GGK80091.1 MerR family transcriptional regulator [Ornithinimicrobium pekingense]